ncbi:DUF4307 domain-containing protein [Propionibacteriaceae bacterium Y2011]|uniref:DUF4307 domain-containing protein n=1 Tax=Microlunatus sp. Y2014 TaxID=3418488 RepID=UPI003B4B4F64
MTSTTSERLARRYPPPRTSPRVAIGLVVAGAALALAWVVWAGLAMATPAVDAQVTRFEVLSDTEARFTATVQRHDTGVAARCRVIAQADNFERVGEVTIELAPGGSELTEVEQTMRTFRRATSLSVDRCSSG